jgi:replication factor C large subunit
MRSGLLWTEKYTPKTVDETIGQSTAIRTIRAFLESFPKKRSMLLAGPPGTGKSSTVMAIAAERNLELIELNASDFRKQADIESKIGAALGQRSLFHRGKIILIDEVDGISGRYDRGGAQALSKLLDKAAFPVFMTANDPEQSKLKTLRKESVYVEFEKVPYRDIAQVLTTIARAEGVLFEEQALLDLAGKSSGDLRAAITDLQLLSTERITRATVDSLDEREREEKIVQALIRVMKTTSETTAKGSFDFLEENIDDILLWIDENVPREYRQPPDLARLYERIIRVDTFNARIRRRQHWRFLAYMFYDLTVGVALAKDEKYPGMPQVKRPMRPLRIWQANMKLSTPRRLAERFASYLHTSQRRLVIEDLAYIQVIANRDPAFRASLIETFELEKKDDEWLSKAVL